MNISITITVFHYFLDLNNQQKQIVALHYKSTDHWWSEWHPPRHLPQDIHSTSHTVGIVLKCTEKCSNPANSACLCGGQKLAYKLLLNFNDLYPSNALILGLKSIVLILVVLISLLSMQSLSNDKRAIQDPLQSKYKMTLLHQSLTFSTFKFWVS